MGENNLICGDCLDVMRGLESASIDLIYLDPPFNKNRTFEDTAGSFDDRFRAGDVDADWMESIEQKNPDLHGYLIWTRTRYAFPYLAYMAIRLLECCRLLKPTGSIYLHCDPSISHYLKMVMDCIFGEKNFRNEIVWCYGGRGMSRKRFQSKHDVILFYSKGPDHFFSFEGASRPVNPEFVGRYNKVDEEGKRFARIKNRDGSYSDIYLKGFVREDWWEIPFARGNERTGYPTQKPLELLERIIKASSNEGDLVLDPFCGSGTTCVAAERLGRKWIGIDQSQDAIDLARDRVTGALL